MTEVDILKFRRSLVAQDTRELQEIYTQYKVDCISFLVSKGYSSREEGEGIFTDAIIALHDSVVYGKVSEIKSMKNYLIGICINIARRQFNKVSRFRDKMEEIRSFFQKHEDNSINDNNFMDQMKQVSRLAIDNLTEQCRKIITYFYLYQLSMKEIAAELQLANSDVAKTLKSRCFKKLMNHVNELIPLQK